MNEIYQIDINEFLVNGEKVYNATINEEDSASPSNCKTEEEAMEHAKRYIDKLMKERTVVVEGYCDFHWDGDTLWGKYDPRCADPSDEWWEVSNVEPEQQYLLDIINKKFNVNLKISDFPGR